MRNEAFPRKSVSVVAAAIFGALAAVITLVEIPFPIIPFLKFNFAEIPDAAAFLLFGPIPGLLAAVVHWIVLTARVGDILGPFFKFAAVVSMLLGFWVGSAVYSHLPRTGLNASLLRSVVLNPASAALLMLGVAALAAVPLGASLPVAGLAATLGLGGGVILVLCLARGASTPGGYAHGGGEGAELGVGGLALGSMFLLGTLVRVAAMTVLNYLAYAIIAPFYLDFAAMTVKSTLGLTFSTPSEALAYILALVALFNVAHTIISVVPAYASILPLAYRMAPFRSSKPWVTRLLERTGSSKV